MELFNILQSSCEADLDQPLFDYLKALQSGKTTPPYIPVCEVKPLYQLAQLALLWSEAGFTQEAGKLAHWLNLLRSYPSLWTTEKQFSESLSNKWFDQLSSLKPIEGGAPPWSYSSFHSSQMNGVITLAGKGTSLGVIRGEREEIRAFGPQSPSLAFGIQGKGLDSWVQSSVYPEVWIECKADLHGEELCLDLRCVGITPQTPLSFAFYLKGPECEINGERLLPKTLRRFNGEGREAKVGSLSIASSQNHKIQIIPLAGEGAFWDCDFLLSFEISSFAPQVRFTIESLFF